ncbi:transcriptional regulator, AraC family [Chishuiella changwenlii]|uniref:AraC family transcriptional regulator n=1 Tax=Chishuiella changwenlii TaxID=1434701 RepID=A0A1M6ZB00_9FLAO|nr:helix-turn-helix domain-containing protein [Chishuiella changwenlii]GGE86598.1 AraC family transcriptional regulator [Chishuiella changwenlii]SHL27574.1 transcriptional regulator, AraC family [Chishuiella changwenlii]
MEETVGLLNKIRQHNKLLIALNENCKVSLPDDVLEVLRKPHRLSFYYFQYMEKGSATFKTDLTEFTIADGELAFGVPNQIFTKLPYDVNMLQYALSFDEHTLSLLPGNYPFLFNPFAANSIQFDLESQQRIKNLLSGLFQLLNGSGKQKKAEVILAHLHTLLTEYNTAYFEQYQDQKELKGSKLEKYIAFKIAVETQLNEHHDVQRIADQLSLTSNTLYAIVKEFGGLSPKEWITNRIMMEAQRKLQYSNLSVKELAYELGFSDPSYFSRLFKKNTGMSVRDYLSEIQDLSSN